MYVLSKFNIFTFRLCTDSFGFLFLQNLQLMKHHLHTMMQARNFLKQDWKLPGTQTLPISCEQLLLQIVKAYLILVLIVAKHILGNQI